jgi:hypothetical protein
MTSEAENVAIGILDVEILRAPRSFRKGPDDHYAVRFALRIERFDAINSSRSI